MAKCEIQRGVNGEKPLGHSIITGNVSNFIKLVETDGSGVGNPFVGKLTPINIDSSRTRFLLEVGSQGKQNGGIPGKEITLVKSVGERVNPDPVIFEDFNMKLHKEELTAAERMERIKDMPHFSTTRRLLNKSIFGIERCLTQIENRIKGAKTISPLG